MRESDPDDWLSVREVAALLEMPVRTVQASFSDVRLRAQWWEPGGVRAWRLRPLIRSTQYQARRWAVMRLVDQDDPAS